MSWYWWAWPNPTALLSTFYWTVYCGWRWWSHDGDTWWNIGMTAWGVLATALLWCLVYLGAQTRLETGRLNVALQSADELLWQASERMLAQRAEAEAAIKRTPLEERSGTVEGWRTYDEHNGLLTGRWGTDWTHRHLSAGCVAGRLEEHLRMDTLLYVERCTARCGIYMTHNPVGAIPLGGVIARCSAWGIVAEHEYGYRVSEAQIEALWVRKGNFNSAELGRWRARYGVPVVEVADWGSFGDRWDRDRRAWKTPEQLEEEAARDRNRQAHQNVPDGADPSSYTWTNRITITDTYTFSTYTTTDTAGYLAGPDDTAG